MLKFIIHLALLCLFLWALSFSWTIGDSKAPPLGNFLSPATGFWANATNQSTFKNAILNIKTPSGKPIKVSFDDRLVPHIFANSDEDAFFAQGYITAYHRLWQMDLATKASVGRISEIIGPRGLDFDRNKRMLGMGYAAERTHEVWKKDTSNYRKLLHYADGVNTFIESLTPATLPLEYKLMQFSPEKWSPYRTIVFSKSMALDLCGKQNDLEYTNTKELFGDQIFNDLFQAFNEKQIPIIPSVDTTSTQNEDDINSFGMKSNNKSFDPTSSENESFLVKNKTEPTFDLNTDFDQIDDVQLGSNNWVVSGKKTASGVPILANDPHLRLTLPSIWYECHIILPESHVYGVSLPGIPGVIIGFNENIAWGVTNAGHDVMDWYKIHWTDETHTSYFLDGQNKKVENRIEVYKVNGEEAVIDTIPYSVWGPIHTFGKYEGMAMKWIAHEAPKIKEGAVFTELNKATDFISFNNTMNDYTAPAQNMVFAAKNGDIAMKISGALPLRKKGQGVYIQDGSKSDNDWQSFIPVNETPLALNPKQNYLASANQVTTDTTYPYFYIGEPYFEDFRGRIVNELLQDMTNITAEDMMEMQYNSVSLKARDILPFFIETMDSLNISASNNQVLTSLREWDYSYNYESKNPIYFNVWYKQFYELTWDEFYQYSDSAFISTPESWRTIELTKTNPNYPFFDIQKTNDKVETAFDIVALSFLKMLEEIAQMPEGESKDWGTFRKTKINHLANLPGLGRVAYQTPGWADALNAISGQNGPSWRMIVEMTNPVKAWVIYPGGQSGNPGSKFYDNMVDDWIAGKYYQPYFTRDRNLLKEHELFEIQIGKE